MPTRRPAWKGRRPPVSLTTTQQPKPKSPLPLCSSATTTQLLADPQPASAMPNPQPLSVNLGWRVPTFIAQVGPEDRFDTAMTAATKAWCYLDIDQPKLAPYRVTLGHYQRLMVQMNARECWHLFQLRAALQSHEAIREPAETILQQVTSVHPILYRQIQLRHYPEWRPLNNEEQQPAAKVDKT